MRSRVLGWSISGRMSDDSAKTASMRRLANEPNACPPRRQCRKGGSDMSTALGRRSALADDLRCEVGELLPVHVGHQGVAQLAAPPEDHIEAARCCDSRHDVADLLEAAPGPRQPFRAEHEERNRVEPTVEHEDGGLTIEVVADGSSLKRELLVSA